MENLAHESSSVTAPHVQHQMHFTASVGDYFGIWLANTALTILTLGFYAPWAKVRRERFLLGHTILDGAAFDYTANPVKILKGRLLILGLFTTAAVVKSISPAAFFLVIAIPVAIGYPWALTMAVRFRCRYTNYRNLSFSFSGRPWDTFLWAVFPKLVSILTLGLLFPWARHKERKYIVNHVRYGAERFRSHSFVKSFYLVYCVAVPCFLVCFAGVVVVAMLPMFFQVEQDTGAFKAFSFVIGMIAASGFMVTYYLVRGWLVRLTWSGATLGGYRLEVRISAVRYAWIAISNLILRIISLGFLTPLCVVRLRRYVVENIIVHGPHRIDQFVADRQQEISSLGDQAADIYDVDVDFGF